MMIACKDCDKRTPGCHGSCEEYQKYRRDLDEQNQKVRDEKQKDRVWDDYKYDWIGKRWKNTLPKSKLFKSTKK